MECVSKMQLVAVVCCIMGKATLTMEDGRVEHVQGDCAASFCKTPRLTNEWLERRWVHNVQRSTPQQSPVGWKTTRRERHTPSLLAWQARSNVESSEEAVAQANPGGKDLTTSASYLVRILPLLAAVRVWVKRLGHVCSA